MKGKLISAAVIFAAGRHYGKALVAESKVAAQTARQATVPGQRYSSQRETSNVTYSEGWTFEQGEAIRGTQAPLKARTNKPYASYDVRIPISSGSFFVFATKRLDGGLFDIFLGDVYIGTGDAHGYGTGQAEVVFSGILDSASNHQGQSLTIRNRESDIRLRGGTPSLEMNQVFFLSASL